MMTHIRKDVDAASKMYTRHVTYKDTYKDTAYDDTHKEGR